MKICKDTEIGLCKSEKSSVAIYSGVLQNQAPHLYFVSNISFPEEVMFGDYMVFKKEINNRQRKLIFFEDNEIRLRIV